tara:strand:- start:2201 stop:2755 length:555 start_codon:yes stop_codon:yes gene_type:complete
MRRVQDFDEEMARKAVSTSKVIKLATVKASKSAKTSKAVTKPVYVLNGPNLNLLGLREPEIYGNTTLAGIEKLVATAAKARGVNVLCLQSNHEGELVTWIQEARSMASGLIINPAAYAHTSIAIHDALAMLDIPVVEVHISNVHKREEFRHYSYVSSVVTGVICGLGVKGYTLALDAILADLSK